MIYIQFLLGCLVYSCLAIISYSPTLKNNTNYYILGLTFALMANAIWLTIAKQDTNGESLLFKGLLWDIMLTLIYIAIPALCFNVKINIQQIAGIGLILIGIILAKVG